MGGDAKHNRPIDDDDNDDDDDDGDDDDNNKRVIFVSREKASIFLSFNECMRRMNCGKKRREECTEECADGNTEEELEEYTEIFENIEEYRGDAKHNRPIDDDDNDDDDDDD